MTNAKSNGKPRDDRPRIVATYDYRDESGNLLFQVVRFEPKDFRQRRPKEGGGWIWSVKGVRVVPYRLPELLAALEADPTQLVYVVEGEKDVDNLARLGIVATCNSGGAGKWTDAHSDFLRGRHVVVIPDNDEPGRKLAQQVARLLHGVAASVRVVELPGLPPKGDASDWIEALGADAGPDDLRAEMERLAAEAPEWTPAAEAWPEIESLDERNLPGFPSHVLPDVLRRWVEEESHATQTPADLAGLLALAICSAALARHVEVNARDGWTEPVNLFCAVLMESGSRKSAVFKDATQPLMDLESELIEAARRGVARAQSQRREAEIRLKKLEKSAGETDNDESRRKARDLAEELATRPDPALPKLIVDDITTEQIGVVLAEQEGRIAIMSAEGGVFDIMAGKYNKTKAPDLGVYLKGHSGDDLKVDRVSRKSVGVKRPAITIVLAFQPAVIEALAETPAFRALGLLARFMYAVPRSLLGQREIATAPVSEVTRDAYVKLVRSLAEVKGEHVLRLAPDASVALEVWEHEIETKLADGGELETIRDWGGKLAGATLRLATVLHCVEHGAAGQINRRAIASAVEIARYLIPHAEAVLNRMGAKEDPAAKGAHWVLRWIEREKRRQFTKRDAQQPGRARFPRADDIDPSLAELVRRGYIRLRPSESTGPGRPPSPEYEVNPAVFAEANTKKRTRNSQNSDDRTAAGNSENTEGACRQSVSTEAKAEGRSHNSQNLDQRSEAGSSEDIESASQQPKSAERVRVTL